MQVSPEANVPCPRVSLRACTSVSKSPRSFVKLCDCVLILGRERTGPMLSMRSDGTLTAIHIIMISPFLLVVFF